MQLSVLACLLYGLLLILFIHTTADGSWFWYAQALQHGQHLYRDLHMPLQPLFPLELEGCSESSHKLDPPSKARDW